MRRIVQSSKKSKPQKVVLTSSTELIGRWASREVLTTDAFVQAFGSMRSGFFIAAAYCSGVDVNHCSVGNPKRKVR
jgi:hypothetical protein